MKSADVVIIGAGVIGLSLACELKRQGASVIVLERHHPGREASWAAGGMIADSEAGPHPLFCQLATASAKLYPGYVHALEDESHLSVDYRTEGKISFLAPGDGLPPGASPITDRELCALEPEIFYIGNAVLLPEATVDSRLLMEALLRAALHLQIEIDSGADVQNIEMEGNRAVAAVTSKARYAGKQFVNCAGAWAGALPLAQVPIRPIKGQMLSVVTPKPLLRHVLQGNGVYVIPRGDGRLVIGSTVEDVGFDKRVDPETIQRLHQAAAVLVPRIGQGRIHETWTGLRPCSADKLPVMGRTSVEGYFVATGHYRDGILLAPITARLMGQLLVGKQPEIDFQEFSPDRFGNRLS